MVHADLLVLNPSALRFLAFLPEVTRNPVGSESRACCALAKLAEAVARDDPDLKPVQSIDGLSLWTAIRPVDVPVSRYAEGSSCSVGWRFLDGRPHSSIGHWGGYVAFSRDDQGRISVDRSVDGLMPAAAVRTSGGTIVASHTPAWLLKVAGVPPEIDWGVIAAVLNDPTVSGHHSALRGVTMIPPGCRLEADELRTDAEPTRPMPELRTVTFWDPCAIAREARPMTASTAETLLREAVDETVDAWAGVTSRVLIELSGGLDSSILAGTLRHEPSGPQVTLVNASTSQAGGDERRYARDVADHCGWPLIEITADGRVLDVTSTGQLVHPSEPILYGLDAGHDEQMTAQAAAVGAGAIFTGQGGDAVFYQMPDLAIAIDAFRLWGWRALWSTHTRDVVRRAQRSVWSAWAAILADRLGRTQRTERFPAPMTTATASDLAAPCVHPWLVGLGDLPPAKARQVEAIAHSQIFNGPTRRGLSTLFVHPLLSQPVVEACLSIPIPVLTGGRSDRTRARAAFADRLPRSVALRHSKGEAASHYNHAVTRALAVLRPLLLDGRLVARGLLNRNALDQALRPETLLWSDLSRPLIVYASIEAWIRYWESADAGS